MPDPPPESPEFARLVAGDDRADLTRIALEIARDADPELDPRPYHDRIAALAARVAARFPAGAGVETVLQQINWALYVEERFSGNTGDYYDARNSYLNEVLDRRTGIPISLGVLYRAIAGRLGVAMAGVNLPAHFVLRAERDEGPIFVDAFHGGALLDEEGCRKVLDLLGVEPSVIAAADFRPVTTAAVVARMLRNLEAIYARSGEFGLGLATLRRLVALEPRDPAHRKGLGLISMNLGAYDDAVIHLSAYLELEPQAGDSAEIRDRIEDSRRGPR